ncbi:Uncharacterised protein [Serratia grimesii]|jgi:hypothetical protein|nr:hypothetical protein 348p1_00061 [Serratia grimesii]CAI2793735.1 Uncharacterised protein [Serratia grimesii]
MIQGCDLFTGIRTTLSQSCRMVRYLIFRFTSPPKTAMASDSSALNVFDIPL